MRFGMVGTGYWAREVHATALAAAPHAEFVGVWGRDPGKTQELADRFTVAAYDDAATMFSDVDAVSFAVPPDVQATLATDAAQAGCHLLLEKPTGLTIDQADAVLSAVQANDVASVVLFTSRFLPEVATWLERARTTGGWSGAQATWLGAIFQPGNPFGASPWRREQGALWDLGPHALSITLPLLGPVTEVTAAPGPGDTVHATLRHVDGASSTLLLSLTAPDAAAGTAFAAYGEAGWQRMPDAPWEPAEAHQAATRALIDAASSGRPHPCDAAFAREAVEVLDRVQRDLD